MRTFHLTELKREANNVIRYLNNCTQNLLLPLNNIIDYCTRTFEWTFDDKNEWWLKQTFDINATLAKEESSIIIAHIKQLVAPWWSQFIGKLKTKMKWYWQILNCSWYTCMNFMVLFANWIGLRNSMLYIVDDGDMPEITREMGCHLCAK